MSLNKRDEDAHYSAVVKGGALGGAVGLTLGLGGVMLASRRYPAFRSLTLPFRTFLVTSSTTFGAIVNADRASVAYAKAQDPMTSYQDASARAAAQARSGASGKERALAWGREHRYSIVFGSWVASMGAALAAVGRAPMSTSQKLVQARVYAQGLTLAVLVLSAAFEVSDAKKGISRWETVRVADPKHPGQMIEKRIHKEEYEGQDLWMDMVAAEEKRMEERKRAIGGNKKNEDEEDGDENKQKA